MILLAGGGPAAFTGGRISSGMELSFAGDKIIYGQRYCCNQRDDDGSHDQTMVGGLRCAICQTFPPPSQTGERK